jgi:hypothetical protein
MGGEASWIEFDLVRLLFYQNIRPNAFKCLLNFML